MSIYRIEGRRINEKTVVFDTSAKEFFANATKRMDNYYFTNGDYIYWDASMNYDGICNYEYIKYRDASGKIVTLQSEENCVTYNHTYDVRIGLAPIYSGYNPLTLLANNKDDPYLEIKFSTWHTIRENETEYNADVISFVGDKAKGTFIPIRVTYKQIEITGTSLIRDSSNKQYLLNVKCNYFDRYTVDIVNTNYDGYGNEKIAFTYESKNETSYVLEKYLLEENKLVIRAYNGNNLVTKEISFEHLTPTIKDLVITSKNNLLDELVEINWTSTNQETAEVYTNDRLIMQVNGSVQLALLKPGTLDLGKNKIVVKIYNRSCSNVVNSVISESVSKEITLTRIMPTITNVIMSDTNIDNEIVITCDTTNTDYLEVWQDDKLILQGNDLVIKQGTFKPCETVITVKAVHVTTFDTIAAEHVINTVLKKNLPVIYNLEPSNLNINVDNMVNVTFATNEFIDKYTLTAAGYIKTGVEERKVVFGKKAFIKGQNKMHLRIEYAPPYNSADVRVAEKTVVFNGYGKPEKPVFDENTIFATATPIINFSAEEFVMVKYNVYKDGILKEEKEVFQSVGSIQLDELEDNSTYTVKVAVKNKYDIYSDYAEKVIETHFNEIFVPDFYLLTGVNSVYITLNGFQDSNFKSLSIFRKTRNEEWLEIADDCNVEDQIIDYTCQGNVELFYKIRVYDKNDAYKESEVKSITLRIDNYILTNLENAELTYNIIGASPIFDYNNNITHKVYQGNKRPRVFKDKTNYMSTTFTFKVNNCEIEKIEEFVNSNDYSAFCLRDRRGKKWFVTASLKTLQPYGPLKTIITLDIIEINFVEEKMYSGSGYKKLTYLNGEYALDGSIDLSGVDENATI